MTKRRPHNQPMPTLKERFDAKWKLDPITGCWIWTAHKSPTGFGVIDVDRKCRMAHRVSYALSTGARVPDGKHVLHLCSSLDCVNPSHLFLGKEHDPISKVRNGRALPTPPLPPRPRHLDDQGESMVKVLRSAGKSHREIAKEVGVSQYVIEKTLGRMGSSVGSIDAEWESRVESFVLAFRGDFVTSREVAAGAFGIDASRVTQTDRFRVAAVMRRLGWIDSWSYKRGTQRGWSISGAHAAKSRQPRAPRAT